MEDLFDSALDRVLKGKYAGGIQREGFDRLDVEGVGVGVGANLDAPHFIGRRFLGVGFGFPITGREIEEKSLFFLGFVALVDLDELRGWDVSEIEQVIGSAEDAGAFVQYVPDPGTMFMVIEKVGEKEFVRAICPLVIWDRWGSFSVGAFRRCGCDESESYWVEKIDEVIVTDAMTVYQVPMVKWMSNWMGKNETS